MKIKIEITETESGIIEILVEKEAGEGTTREHVATKAFMFILKESSKILPGMIGCKTAIASEGDPRNQ